MTTIAGSWMHAEIDAPRLRRTVIVLLPLLLVALVTGDERWLGALVVTISCFIAFDSASLAPTGVLLHGLVVLIGFLALFFALRVPVVFVLGCAVLAAITTGITRYGSGLRSLGSFTFVPALYLACEAAENCPPAMFPQRAAQLLPYFCAAILPVLVASLVVHSRNKAFRDGGILAKLTRLRGEGDLGERRLAGEAVVAVVLAVSIAAALVEWLRLDHGQWVVWSAASIVTGDIVTARRKLRDRAGGALVGVPVGIVLGFVLPHATSAYLLMTIAIPLTFVAFRRYWVGFGARCACIACALVLTGQSAAIAEARALNVLLGGVIGALCVFGINAMARSMRA